jgi:hypothetical protein
VYAIKACTVENLDRNYKNMNIYIVSQAAIKAIFKHQISSKLVWDCHQSHMQLARHNRVQLIWVQEHKDIAGNETADQLTRTESEHPFIGPEPACGISIGVAKNMVRGWTNRNHKKILEICNLTQTGKRTCIRALCQIAGSVKTKQRPVKMGGRSTYRTLSPKVAPFQIGIG